MYNSEEKKFLYAIKADKASIEADDDGQRIFVFLLTKIIFMSYNKEKGGNHEKYLE